MLTRDRKERLYTILSEQTNRDEVYGEIDQTVITRNPDGTLCLGPRLSELVKEEKRAKDEEALERLVLHIVDHPSCEMEDIVGALGMSKRNVLALMKKDGTIEKKGEGIKGDPYKYFVSGFSEAETASLTDGTQIASAQAEAARLAESGGMGRPN